MKNKMIALAVAGVLASGVALADDAAQGSMYVMPVLGYMHTDSDLAADNDAAYGIRLGKSISEHWDVQLGATHARADSDNPIAGQVASGRYKQTLFGVDALYMFSRDKFRPFLLAGFGGAHNTIGYNIGGANYGGSKTSLMGNLGLGFQYLFTDTIGLQADLRHVWSSAKSNPALAGFNIGNSDTVGNTYFNLGLIINFGAPAKQAAPEPVAETPASNLAEVAPKEDEPLPPMTEEKQPEPVGPDAPAFVKMTLQAEVLFDFDKAVLKNDGKKILDAEVVEKMKAHPEVELVLITGHTDRIGDDKYNQKLSERRAEAVKKYVASQGVDAGRLHAVGKGATQPVVACKGVRGKKLIECLQPSRRVVVEIEAQRQVAP